MAAGAAVKLDRASAAPLYRQIERIPRAAATGELPA